mgnify:CR=1 FL=1
MTTSREMVLIGGVVNSLRSRGSWTGETHIQKTAYVAKIRRNVPFESEFVLYKHGPFSFELSKSIGHMLSRDLLSSENNRGYGPSYALNRSLWTALNKGLSDFYSDFSNAIDDIGIRFSNKNVAELERIATAVYVVDKHPHDSDEFRAEIITKIKPHISRETALEALQEAAEI